MEEKLILRAAIKYRNWMLKESIKHKYKWESTIKERTLSLVRLSKEMLRWSERFFIGSKSRLQHKEEGGFHRGIISQDVYKNIVTDMIPDLEHGIELRLKNAVGFLNASTKESPITVLSLRDAIEEIRVIDNAWENVVYKGGEIWVPIADVILSDGDKKVDLGSFGMKLSLNNPLDGLSIIPTTHIESNKGYCHPHVSGENLCAGDGGLLMKEALCQGRLEDYFRIVEAILRTYNYNSPYEKLSNWYNSDHEGEFYCEPCEEWRSDDDSCYCEGCATEYCVYCDNGNWCCSDCGEWRCGECSVGCHGCDETVCSLCTKSCSKCCSSFCSKCLDTCTICDDEYCGSCLKDCAHCGDHMCDDCTFMCGCCEKNCCSECVDETCNKCKKEICKGCEATCSKCDKSLCAYCADKACEHCGTLMCQSCANEHNCPLEEVSNV